MVNDNIEDKVDNMSNHIKGIQRIVKDLVDEDGSEGGRRDSQGLMGKSDTVGFSKHLSYAR